MATQPEKLRVLFAQTSRIGGSVKRLGTFLAHLDPARVEAGVLCGYPRTEPVDLAAIPSVAWHYDLGLAPDQQPDMWTRVLGLLIPTPLALRYFVASLRVIARHRPDIVYLNAFPWPHFPLVLAARLMGCRVIAHLRSGRELGAAPGIQNRWVNRFIALSDQAARSYVAQGVAPDRITVIRNAVALDEFDRLADQDGPGLPESDAVNAVLVAHLVENKRPELAIEALAAARRECPRLRLVLVGDGRRREALEKLVADRGLAREVVFLGFTKNVPRVLRDCHIGLMTSRKEGSPNVVIEYMAAGLPVITVPIPGIDEMVENGASGVILPDADPARLAQALVELYRSEARRREMGRRGREIIAGERFSLQREHEAIRTAVERVAAVVPS